MLQVGDFFNEYYLKAIDPRNCPTNSTTELNTLCSGCSDCNQPKEAPICFGDLKTHCSLNSTNGCVNKQNTTAGCHTIYEYEPCENPPGKHTLVTCEYCELCEESGTQNLAKPLKPRRTHNLTSSDCNKCFFCRFDLLKTDCNRCDHCESCSLFLNCDNSTLWDEIEQNWGLDYDKSLKFVAFLLASSQVYAEPYLEYVLFEGGGGLFPIRTVNNWIFDAQDPLMKISDPTYPNAGNLIQNMTSVEDALSYHYGKITTYTGKNNITQVAQYKSFNGSSEIGTKFYREPVPITGCTEWGQFQPFLNERDEKNLYTFDGTFFRNMHLVRTGSVKYRDVPMWRFMISNDTLEPNPTYYQEIRGFANSTSFHDYCPIFYSNPHWAGVDDYYANRVIGVAENRNYKTDYTFVDVEPVTGMVMHVNETLQVNVFLNANYSNLNKYYSPPIDTFYPIVSFKDEIFLVFIFIL